MICHEAVGPRRRMRDYTTKEKLKITAGALASLVVVGWLVVLAVVFLSVR
jgi:succinate dehydrogenase hydrophobic anchor subunit